MINLMTDEVITTSETYYGYKIKSYYNAYGTAYDFCRFYCFEYGTILIYNSTMVIDNTDISDELLSFVAMINPVSIEIRTSFDISPVGCNILDRTMFEFVSGQSEISFSDIVINSDFNTVYKILDEGFGTIDYDGWYVDISHRTRHNVAETFLYKDKVTATKQFENNDFCFFSHIATSKSARGKGYARQLLYTLSEYYSMRNVRCFLFALDKRVSFYKEIGFKEVYKDKLYELKQSGE